MTHHPLHPAPGRGAAAPVAVLVLAITVLGALPRQSIALEPVGTFSIVARDTLTGELGVAVQSRAFSVGAGVAWAEAGTGAIATQATTNESFGPRGLELLAAGLSAEETLQFLLGQDSQVVNRQVGIIDVAGHTAAHTGEQCQDWAGHQLAANVSCQGNILAGAAVVDTMFSAFHMTEGELSRRLLAALVAAQAAGGDRRGMQSAALLVVRPSDRFPEYRTRYVSLRVEDHPDPISELIRVYEIHETTDLVRAHIRYAEEYDAAGRTELAEGERQRVGETLQRVLARDEADAGTLNGLAWFMALGEVYLADALTAARRAAEMEPESAEILDTLAEVHFRRGEFDEAVTVGKRALALEPEGAYYKEQLERFEQGLRGQQQK